MRDPLPKYVIYTEERELERDQEAGQPPARLYPIVTQPNSSEGSQHHPARGSRMGHLASPRRRQAGTETSPLS